MPSRQTRKKTKAPQTGGKDLYLNVDEITEDVIENTFCNGSTIESLPVQPKPIFVLKWGPPGSGKSSAKMEEFIRSLGVPLNSYMNYNSDDIFERMMLFRLVTTLHKMTALQAKANYEQGDFAHAQSLLQHFLKTMGRYPNFPVDLSDRTQQLFQSRTWARRELSEEQKTVVDKLLSEIVEAISTEEYEMFRRHMRNSSGLSIQEKLKRVLAKAFRKRVNIIYESTGWGYKSTPIGTVRNSFRHIRPRVGVTTRAASNRPENVIDMFKNSKEILLGKLVYNEDKEPIGIDTSSLTEESVPLGYAIYVVYPILPKREIFHRALTRAVKYFTHRNNFAIPPDQTKEKYMELYKYFLKEILNMMGGPDTKRRIDELVKEESEDYNESYSSYLQALYDSADEGELSPPFFRSVSIQKIEQTIDQAFQYSIDYFLKQYLIIGRIERVIYISTLGEKYMEPVPRNLVNVVL